MMMARDAWNAIEQSTIQNCWNHTGILPTHPSPRTSIQSLPNNHAAAWDLMREFATTDLGLPQAEERLKTLLGDQYVDEDWRPMLCAVMEAEGNVETALNAIERLTKDTRIAPPSRLTITIPPRASKLTITIPPQPREIAPQIASIEDELMASVAELKRRNRIVGEPIDLENLVNPREEREIGENEYGFEGGDDEIVAVVRHEIAVENGDVIEVESKDEGEVEEGNGDEAMKICQKLEAFCIKSGAECSLELSRELRHFRGYLNREIQSSLKQVSLDVFFSKA